MPKPPDTWRESSCVCTTVRRADRALNRLYDEALKPSGLVTTQYALLSFLARAPEKLPLGELAEAQVMDRTTLSRNLEPLERAGYVRVEPGEDKRRRVVSLTAAGNEAYEKARPLWYGAQSQVQAEHGARRIEQLLAELKELTAELVSHAPKGAS
jgi:DNA-binding MarR family transcriptional regulator